MTKYSRTAFRLKILVIFAVGFLIGRPAPALSQALTAESLPVSVIKDIKWPDAVQDPKEKSQLYIIQGTSQVYRFDRGIARVSVSNPDVVDILPLGFQEILIHAKSRGSLNLILWDENQTMATYDVYSVIDVDRLDEILTGVDPTADVQIIPFKDLVAIFGQVETRLKLEQIDQAARAFNTDILNFVRVREPKQILLEIRFAEVDREAGKDFGLDLETITRYMRTDIFNANNFGGSGASGTFTPEGGISAFQIQDSPSASTSNFGFDFVTRSASIQSQLDWLITKDVLKLIARPNLLAKDGEEASIVVGGEQPFITTTDANVNVQFKEFGTGLTFTPEVLDDNLIRLKVHTEISELDFSNSVTLQGTQAPSIIKSEHKTVAELRDGQSLVIGGLLTQRINYSESKFPILGDIPLLNKLFRKESYSRKDVEQIIIMTPHLIAPMDLNQKRNIYPEEVVRRVVESYYPVYPDDQADMIQLLYTQNENYQTFDPKAEKTALEMGSDLQQEVFDVSRFAKFADRRPPRSLVRQTEPPYQHIRATNVEVLGNIMSNADSRQSIFDQVYPLDASEPEIFEFRPEPAAGSTLDFESMDAMEFSFENYESPDFSVNAGERQAIPIDNSRVMEPAGDSAPAGDVISQPAVVASAMMQGKMQEAAQQAGELIKITDEPPAQAKKAVQEEIVAEEESRSSRSKVPTQEDLQKIVDAR